MICGGCGSSVLAGFSHEARARLKTMIEDYLHENPQLDNTETAVELGNLALAIRAHIQHEVANAIAARAVDAAAQETEEDLLA